MKRSTERILTTHAGRLPNPDNIAAILQARADGDQATFDQLVRLASLTACASRWNSATTSTATASFGKRATSTTTTAVSPALKCSPSNPVRALHPGAPARTAYAGVPRVL